MDSISGQGWFERVAAFRDEVVYPELFGALEPSIDGLTAEFFREMFGEQTADPSWLQVGVMRAAPTRERPSWLYVTSGLSNPRSADPDAQQTLSGLGCELVLETVEDADWAILRLQHVAAFELLLSSGRYPGKPLLRLFDRLPLRDTLVPGERSVLRNIMIAPATGYPWCFKLESGRVDLFSLVGISDAEAAYARSHDGDALLALMQRAGAYPINDPKRLSVV